MYKTIQSIIVIINLILKVAIETQDYHVTLSN